MLTWRMQRWRREQMCWKTPPLHTPCTLRAPPTASMCANDTTLLETGIWGLIYPVQACAVFY